MSHNDAVLSRLESARIEPPCIDLVTCDDCQPDEACEAHSETPEPDFEKEAEDRAERREERYERG